MSAESPLPPELSKLEAQLQGLAPAASTVSRETLLFEAGFAAASASRRGDWLWPGISSALAAALVFVLVTRPASRVENPLEPGSAPAVQVELAQNPFEPLEQADASSPEFLLLTRWYSTRQAPMLALRERVLSGDMFQQPVRLRGSLPESAPATNRQLLNEFLPRPVQNQLGESS